MNRSEAVLLEDMNHKFDLILEGIAPLSSMQQDIAQLKADMVEVKGNIVVIKKVLKEHSRDIAGLRQAIA